MLVVAIAVVIAFIAILTFGFQEWKYRRRARIVTQELEDYLRRR